jgi:hypothetical protein
MTFHRGISGLSKFLTLVLLTLSGALTQAQITGPSVQEVKFSYAASFEIPVSADEKTDEDRIHLHASHLFGLFHSPKMVAQFGINKSTGGIGGPRAQMKFKVISSVVEGDLVKINYTNSGKMILHQLAAEKLLKTGVLDVPLPANPYTIYDEKCTDEHYSSFGDFWYFYDPFREGCEALSKEPQSHLVHIAIKAADYKKMETTIQLPKLRGDNGNGSLFSIYVIHGFESDPKDKDDSGRLNFNEFNDYLKQNNFIEDKLKSKKKSSLYAYTKEITLENGKVIPVEVKHLLVTTSIGSKSKVFAQFFKEAAETADVIIYGGHSGLGGNLDIPSLEEKAGKFRFNPNKKQVFFFDSCSSYSYYLEPFAVEKTKAKIDIISYGLSSFFQTSNGVLASLLDQLLTEKTADLKWSDILQNMENTLQGDTYLLNVGGL